MSELKVLQNPGVAPGDKWCAVSAVVHSYIRDMGWEDFEHDGEYAIAQDLTDSYGWSQINEAAIDLVAKNHHYPTILGPAVWHVIAEGRASGNNLIIALRDSAIIDNGQHDQLMAYWGNMQPL